MHFVMPPLCGGWEGSLEVTQPNPVPQGGLSPINDISDPLSPWSQKEEAVVRIWGGTNMLLSCAPPSLTCIIWIQLSHPASSFF